MGLDVEGGVAIIQDEATLERELVEIIFDECDVGDHTPDELRREDPLIGPESPLGLDSLDSLEIIVAVGKKYGVRIAHDNSAMRILASLDTLIEFVGEHRTK